MNTKRDITKAVVGIGATIAVVPGEWMKPMVRSVLLPVHAQTSVQMTCSVAALRTTLARNEAVDITVSVTPPLSNVMIQVIAVQNDPQLTSPFPGQIVTTDANGNAAVSVFGAGNVVTQVIVGFFLTIDDNRSLLNIAGADCNVSLTIV